MTIDRRDFVRFTMGAGVVALAQAPARLIAATGPNKLAPAGDPLRLIDPELRTVARAMLAMGKPAMTPDLLPKLRASWPIPPLLAAPAVEVRTVPGAPGNPAVSIEVIGADASRKPRPAVLHIHGGGMIIGRARNMTSFCQSLATEFDCVVINVDYRLSPETTFPGPVLDNYAGLEWLHAHAAELGVDPARIAIMGESAGGGLAALVGLMARDRGVVPVCQAILLYPMLDDRTGSSRKVPPHIAPVGWSAEANRYGWSAFLGKPAGSKNVPADAAPARFADVAGFPPTFIGAGGLDLFVDENVTFGRRLLEAGVPTHICVVPGAFHGFDVVVPNARISQEFTQAWKASLRAAFSVT